MIGVVGPAADADRLAETVRTAGATATAGSAADVLAADPAAVAAVGEAAVLALVRAGVEVPVLPVDAGAELPSVPGDSAGDAVERLAADAYAVTECPLLSVAAGDLAARALFDAMLVTTDPVHISEYAVHAGAGRAEEGADGPAADAGAAGTQVARFRADGVVAATPTGSRGYARAAGGPVLDPDADAFAVVPVAPFAVERDQWVLRPPVALSVERDESRVSLLVDGRDLGPLSGTDGVTLGFDGNVRFAVVAESRPSGRSDGR